MKLKIYTVFDVKAVAYLPPFFMRNDGEARRVFGDLANDISHQFGKHPEDYILYQVGVFDDFTGEVKPDSPHQLVAKAVELLDRRDPLPLFPSDRLARTDREAS